jgi:chitin disaccharide deacetylase
MNQPARLASAAHGDYSGKSEVKSPGVDVPTDIPASRNSEAPQTGHLIINADDWGGSRDATDRTLECSVRNAVSSVSAMVFMEDSQRAAELAGEAKIDVGLHLNLTTPFSAPGCSAGLIEHHRKVVAYLKRHRLAQVVYHPGLNGSFHFVVSAQLDEFRRLYHKDPERIDGHHHMHLCANVLLPGLLPAGTIARRNFSFQPGEKSFLNRLYRQFTDRILARHHRLTDFFFSLPPLEPAGRLQQIFALARKFVVEVETHPENIEEYRFLVGGEIFSRTGDLKIAPRFLVHRLARS